MEEMMIFAEEGKYVQDLNIPVGLYAMGKT